MNFPIIQNTYNFECTKCGNCCTGDQKVNLNPYDLYKMARYKNFTHTKELFDSGLVHLIFAQNDAWIPQIKFKSMVHKKLIFCPFLINEFDDSNRLLGLCSLHPDFKPLICSMAPIGRVFDFKEQTEHYLFVKPAPDCPGVGIKKVNYLSDLEFQFEKELYYEKEFFRMLEQLQSSNYSKEYYLEKFYYFPAIEDFRIFG